MDNMRNLDSGPGRSGLCIFGPSGVRALPLAAGINVGGHYSSYFGPSKVHAPAEQT